jgi:glutamine cyclotransferase
MKRGKLKVGDFCYVETGGIIKVSHINDNDQVSGTWLNNPIIQSNIQVKIETLTGKVRDTEQIKVLQRRVNDYENNNVNPPTS